MREIIFDDVLAKIFNESLSCGHDVNKLVGDVRRNIKKGAIGTFEEYLSYIKILIKDINFEKDYNLEFVVRIVEVETMAAIIYKKHCEI